MCVLIYQGDLDVVGNSGVGEAVRHQMSALEKAGVPFTTNPEDDYEIVHINTVLPKSYYFACKAKREGKKVIYYGHSTEDDFRNSFRGSNVLAPLFKQWIARCYRSGDIVITPTEYSKHILQSYGLERPIYAVSNGIDLEAYQKTPEARRRFRAVYNFSEEDKVVMSAGHYIERKGIDDFIAAARMLPQYQFIWFGYTPPSLIPASIAEAMEHKPDNLQFPGYVDGAHLRDAYAGADLFMFMTHEETEGIVLLEALAGKLPVLLRDIPIYEDLEDGRVVYKATDTASFVSRCQAILEGRLPDLSEEGYKVAKEKSLLNVGRQLKAIYRQLA